MKSRARWLTIFGLCACRAAAASAQTWADITGVVEDARPAASAG